MKRKDKELLELVKELKGLLEDEVVEEDEDEIEEETPEDRKVKVMEEVKTLGLKLADVLDKSNANPISACIALEMLLEAAKLQLKLMCSDDD